MPAALPPAAGKAPKYGEQIRTEPKCKICNCEHRAEIEDILYLRSVGELMPNGIRPTADWIKQNSEALWGLRLTDENLKLHFRKHFAAGKREVDVLDQKDVSTQLRQMLDAHGIEQVSPEQFLTAMVSIGYAKLLADPAKITMDQALKAVDSLTRRRHDESAAKLMQTLAESTGAAIRKIPNPPDSPTDGDVIEAEVVEPDEHRE